MKKLLKTFALAALVLTLTSCVYGQLGDTPQIDDFSPYADPTQVYMKVKYSDYHTEKNGESVAGEQYWHDFYDSVLAGEAATLKQAGYHTNDVERDPWILLSQVSYDGSCFTYTSTSRGFSDDPSANTRTYRYLRHFVERIPIRNRGNEEWEKIDNGSYIVHLGVPIGYREVHRYVLTNDDSATWREITDGIFLSDFSNIPDIVMLYSESSEISLDGTPPTTDIDSYDITLPAEQLLKQVKQNDFVVHEDGDVSAGKDIWQTFYDTATSGIPAAVKLATYYTLDRDRVSPEYYEQYKDDYPVIYLAELIYDGECYIYRSINGQDGVTGFTHVYPYLLRYEDVPGEQATFTFCERYVLVPDSAVTWDKLQWGMVSSQLGDFIPHMTVYSDYQYKPEYSNKEKSS